MPMNGWQPTRTERIRRSLGRFVRPRCTTSDASAAKQSIFDNSKRVSRFAKTWLTQNSADVCDLMSDGVAQARQKTRPLECEEAMCQGMGCQTITRSHFHMFARSGRRRRLTPPLVCRARKTQQTFARCKSRFAPISRRLAQSAARKSQLHTFREVKDILA